MKSRIMLTVALGIASVTAAVPASASSMHITYTEAFTVTGGPSPLCPNLPTGLVVNGTIEGTDVITTSVNNAGVMHVNVNSLELGSATDSNGATYVVNYHNHTGYDIQPGGFPYSQLTNDHFNLVGSGQAGNMQVHFVIRLTFVDSVTPPTFQVVNEHGDAFDCDVI